MIETNSLIFVKHSFIFTKQVHKERAGESAILHLVYTYSSAFTTKDEGDNIIPFFVYQ